MGEVRLRKEVVTEQRNVEVPVTREEVVIERHAATGDELAEGAIGEGEEVRIPLMEEEVRVEKTPVVREEVSIRKRQVQDTERISETVRREEARIEGQGDARISERTGRASAPWRGDERRDGDDAGYTGPERRLSGELSTRHDRHQAGRQPPLGFFPHYDRAQTMITRFDKLQTELPHPEHPHRTRPPLSRSCWAGSSVRCPPS